MQNFIYHMPVKVYFEEGGVKKYLLKSEKPWKNAARLCLNSAESLPVLPMKRFWKESQCIKKKTLTS